MKNTIWKVIRATRSDAVFIRLATYKEFFRRFIPRHTYYNSTKKRITRHGIQYNLDLSDYTQWKIYSCNVDGGAALASKILSRKSSAVILDVGSNVGEFTFNVIAKSLKSADKKLTIFTFEPNPRVYSILKENLSLNNFPDRIQVKAFNVGLGDKKGVLKMNVVPNHSGASSLLSSTGNTDVEIWRLDDLLESQNLTSVDFIKVDVECFEPFVLKGCDQVIKKFKPFIFLEHNVKCNNLHKMGENFVFKFLLDHGYKIDVEIQGRTIHISDFNALRALGKVDILASPL